MQILPILPSCPMVQHYNTCPEVLGDSF
jgi:hypothetical protein